MAQQALEHDRGIVDRQREGQPLGAPAQRRHDRHDVVRRIGCDPEMPAGERLLARQQRPRLVLQGEQPGRDAMELPPALGGRDAAAAPVEQAHAVGLLQCSDLAREIGLAEAGGAGSAGEGARFGHEVEGAKLAGRHISVIDRWHRVYILDG